MSNKSGSVISEEEADKLAESEMLDEARDVASNLELTLQQVRTGHIDGKKAAEKLVQDSSNLRFKAKSVSIPGFAAITHRLDEYLGGVTELQPQHIKDLQTYSDRILALLDGEDLPQATIAEVVRSMPHKSTFNVEDIEITNTEVLLVIPQKTAGKVVARELEACGYRVTSLTDPLEAITMVLDTRPDLIITSMVMPRLGGADLACALKAMPSTRNTHVAVLTSLTPDHPDMQALPMNVGVIRRGNTFGDDLADVLHKFNIT
ncbi:response regulator [Kiloniella laminariae]|uniref:Response regulator n=1 Tax=Kiloniella laminariae TaxID=454162 RepID=A0ABT4LNJ6_9PROT|nr:response regulator [Kiloniella laminariae]MCZ4282663.1 response regulator [Kiloniella laminariae]